ncbi:MAG: DNA primase [Deltaproteobacteria bacterium]|nr:DNA primase [Deltaproteobacteria bacterium]
MDSSEAKEEVKKTADIVEVIGQYVELKKRGQNHIGLCPFHSERSPSFTVNQSKQIYHCFGCGRGGDVFTFWMEYHNSDFPQSLKSLAERYNIPLPQKRDLYADRKKTELKEQLFKINDLAGRYFHNILVKSANGKPGRDYFSRRYISQETIAQFRLGYVVNKWDGLLSYLKSKNCSLDRAAKAGLLIPKNNKEYYDRFRGRIMFPIFDLNHHSIGFGGRILDDSLPKYINTPETPIYHKGYSLYGLDSAFEDIRKKDLTIIVEGYMDMLVLRQHGISNVVASLGTALTSDQIRRLKGYTKNVIVLFDPDDAGREAALKSFPLFLNEGISAKVVVLPQGEDPDSFVNKHGSDAFKKVLERAAPIFDFYLDQTLAHMGHGVDGQIKALSEVLPVFMNLGQGATRFLYVHRFAEKTGINEATVWEELKHREGTRTNGRDIPQLKSKFFETQDPRKYGSDLPFFNLLLHYPEKIDTFRDQEWELIVSDPEIIAIIKVVMEKFPSEGNLDRIEEFLDSPVAKEQLRVSLMSQPFYSAESVSQAVSEFEKKIAQVKVSQSIRKASAEGDMEMLNRLIREKQDLDSDNKGIMKSKHNDKFLSH